MSRTDPASPAALGFLAFLELQRAEYRQALPQRLAQIEGLWHQVLTGDSAAQALASLERCAHSLAGSGATFGFAGVGDAARGLERAVAPLPGTAGSLTAGAQSEVSRAIESLQRSLPGDTGPSGPQPQARP